MNLRPRKIKVWIPFSWKVKADPRLSLGFWFFVPWGLNFWHRIFLWIGVNVVKVQKQQRMQKLGAANREIRGWSRKSCLGKTGFRPEHLLPIKVSNSSTSSNTIWRLFHWLLNCQILLYYVIHKWIRMEKSVVLTYFNNHFGVTPSTASVCNKLALWCWTPGTITVITSNSMVFHPATWLPFSLLSNLLWNVAFSEQIQRSYGNILISHDQQAPVCTPGLMHLPSSLICLSCSNVFLPCLLFPAGPPYVPTGKNAKYNAAGPCQGKLTL